MALCGCARECGNKHSSGPSPHDNPEVGDSWYKTDTSQLFRYTDAGVGYLFWLEISG